MGYYVLTERECNTLTNNLLSGLDAVRTRDEWICDEAVELLSDSLVILDDLNLYTGTLNKMNSNETISESKVEEVKATEAKVVEATEKAEVSTEAKEAKAAVEAEEPKTVA